MATTSQKDKVNPLVEHYKKQNKDAAELKYFYQELSKTYEGRQLLDKVGLIEDPSKPRSTVGKKLLNDVLMGAIAAPDAFLSTPIGIADAISSFTGGGGATKDAEAAITKGGIRNLTTVHTSDAHGLLSALKNGGALDLMSYGITKRAPIEGFGDTTLVLNPKVLDPAENPNSRLWNRDTYTPTRGQAVADHGSINYEWYRKFKDAMKMGQQAEPGFEHALAIKAAPEFRSFRQYEKSSAGAATLDKTEYTPINDLLIDMEAVSPLPRVGYGNFNDDIDKLYKEVVKRAQSGDENALLLLHTLKRQKSDYAEGKLLEPFELNSDNVVGAIFNPSRPSRPLSAEQVELQKGLRNKGIDFADKASALLPQSSIDRRAAVAELKAERLINMDTKQYNAAMNDMGNKWIRDNGGHNLSQMFDLKSKIHYAAQDGDVKSLSSILLDQSLNSPNVVEEVFQQLLHPSRLD